MRIIKYPSWACDALIAFVVALAIMTPQIAFDARSDFRGLYLSASSDETHYVTQVRDVAEGWWWLPNAYIYEGRTGAPNLYWAISLPLGFLFRFWPHMDVATFVLMWKFIGFGISTWFLLRIARFLRPEWPNGWRVATVGGFFFLSGLLSPSLVPQLLQSLSGRGDWWEFLAWTRFSNPVVSGMAFLGFIYAWMRFSEQPTWKRAIPLGVFGGVLAWIYLFFWMFVSALLGVWGALLLIRRKFTEAIQALPVFIGTIVVGLTYVLWVHWETRDAQEFQMLGPHTNHSPIFEKSVIVAAVLFLVTLILRVRTQKRALASTEWALIALAITSIAAVNQQVITGQSLEPHHFYFITDLPFAGFLVVFAAAEWFQIVPFRRLTSIAGWAAAALLLWSGIGVQVATVYNETPIYSADQRYAPAFEWINTHPFPYVVLADDDASELIPMYTHADVYYAPHANTYTTTPLERRTQALNVYKRLEGVTAEQAPAVFEAKRDVIGSNLFGSQYYRQICGTRGCFPQEIMDELVRGYQASLKEDFESELHQYRVDAILWDETKDSQWHLEQYPFLQKTEQWGTVSIWTFQSISDTTSGI